MWRFKMKVAPVALRIGLCATMAAYLLLSYLFAMAGMHAYVVGSVPAMVTKAVTETKLFFLVGPALNLLLCSYPPQMEASIGHVSHAAVTIYVIEMAMFLATVWFGLRLKRQGGKALVWSVAGLFWLFTAYLAVELIRV